jgi:hypothetical protein
MKKISVLIHDFSGGELRLERTRLIEDNTESGFFSRGDVGVDWQATYVAIRRAYKLHSHVVRIEQTRDGKMTSSPAIYVEFYTPQGAHGNGKGVIGCRTFSAKTFNQILKAAGIETRAKAKAKAAKAGR